MNRIIIHVAILSILLLLQGCAGYRVVDKPWLRDGCQFEFESKASVEAGNNVRLTMGDGAVFEGMLVSIDEYAVTLADSAGAIELVTLTVDDIQKVEVYVKGRTGLVAKLVAVAGASLFVYKMVENASEPSFGPDADVTK